MADFFGPTASDGRSESFMVDSIMMPILHCAMNSAHDRVRSRDGVLQRLVEQSKFCDLAVMQLDACVSCLQSADDDRGFHRETTAYRNLVSDLTEIRDRLLSRLRETECAIADKDKELQRLRNWFRNQKSRKEEEKEHLKEDQNILEEKKKADLDRDKGGGDNKSKSVQDCDQIGSEINSLKRTLDVAMLVMQNAISVTEVRPFDQQFCLEMEKEIMTTLFGGFVRDFQVRFGEESAEIRENWSPLGASSLSGLMDDLLSLRGELESLASSIAKVESKSLLVKKKEKDSKEELKDGGVNKVSLIIKAHESIINKKSEKLDVRCKETDELQKCIHGMIKKLDSLSRWNEKVDSLFNCDDKSLNNEKENSADTWEYDKSINEISLSKKDAQELDLQVEINEEIQSILLRCMKKDFQQHMYDHDIKNSIAIGVCLDLVHESVKDMNKSIEKTNIRENYTQELNLQDSISGEIQSILLRSVMKDFQQHIQDHELMNSITEIMYKDLLRETIKNETNKFAEEMADQWKHDMENCTSDSFLREEIHEQVFKEALKCSNLVSQKKELRTMCNSLIASETRLHIESTVKEIVYTHLLNEIASHQSAEAEEFRFENTIENEVYQSTILYTLKDVCALLERYEYDNYDRSFHENLLTKDRSICVDRKHNNSFIESLDSLLCYVEQQSLLGPSSDNEKQDNEQFIIQDLEHETLMIEENNREMEFDSFYDKFKKALEQLQTSKMLLKDLGYEQESEMGNDDGERGFYHQRKVPIEQLREERKHHTLFLQETKGSKINQLSGFGSKMEDFFQLIANFENVLHQKLDFNFVRVERLKGQLLQLVGLIAPIRRNESLYRQAFIRRCENLQKAETEVDILGDQVNTLLSLLERIYAIIQYHAPALQQSSAVLNILTLIKKAVNGVTA
ncbi:hypothetical protein V2J09_022991 [Rumex salicifolius]